MTNKTNFSDFMAEQNCGITLEKIEHILSDAALATVLHGIGNKKGKVNLEFSLSKIGDGEQVIISTKLSCSIPTKRGKKSEEDITDTPMFVGKGGQLTIDQPKEDNNGQFALVQGIKEAR